MDNEKCSQGECDRPVDEDNLCRMHYMRRWRGATPEQMAAPPRSVRKVTCGHPDRPHSSRGMCRSCYQMWWMRENPDKNSGNTWLKNHPEEARAHSRKLVLKKHGITPEDYDRLWTEQGGQCANPSCDFMAPMVMDDYRQGLQVDHCHRSLAVRGLLCGGCNRALGGIDDDAVRLAGLIEYLGMN